LTGAIGKRERSEQDAMTTHTKASMASNTRHERSTAEGNDIPFLEQLKFRIRGLLFPRHICPFCVFDCDSCCAASSGC